MTSTDSFKCTKITTAVEFLSDVSQKGYSEGVLKKYLMEKRGLTSEEVDVAFVINKNRLETAEREKRVAKENVGKLERNEKPTGTFSGRGQIQDVGFLVPAKQKAGQQLINDFLDSEKAYCTILECLMKEYHEVLARFADRARFDMSRKEVDEMFFRIPDLLKFHKDFFLDVKRGSNIGRMFVRLFKFFEGYAEYMKDCQKSVNKMRKYIRDTRLLLCLMQVSERSMRRNDDLMDLLITPLERMLDYRDFLNKLYSWADRTQTTNYELLGKASRRIGRVATYIEKYKYGICNQNEMNKVQKFLSDQCDILAPDRAIVRRGMMIRRSSGWTARKKRYVFFLFNDMLLWTNKNGTLQNAVQLRSCEVMPSSAKNYAHRKFEVVYRGEKHKSLKLECAQVRERNEWYEAVKRTIASAKETCNQAWSRSESLSNVKYKEYSNDLSDDEEESKTPPPGQSASNSKEEDEDHRVEQSEQIDDPYNKRYTVTSSFRIQEFKEIDPMDDNVSQISEQDVAFHQEHRNYTGLLPTSAQLSPFGADSNNVRGSANVFRVGSENDSSSVAKVQKNSQKDQETKEEDSFEFFDQQRKKKPDIIRRPSMEVEAREETSPRFTIRLDSY